jgi:hypothetical protein
MASTFFQRIVLIIILVGYYSALQAQEYKFEIGGMAGGAFYMGDVNKNTLFKGLNPAFGGVFRYNANFRWAVKANLTWARVSGTTEGLDNVFPGNAAASFDRDLFELGGQMEFNFFAYSDKYPYMNTKRFTPYILLGLGVTVAPGSGQTFAGPNVPLGIGVKYKLMNRINVGCEFSFRKLFGDNFDVTNDGNSILDNPYHIEGSILKNKDWYSLLLLSITWDFGPRSRSCNNINSTVGF